MTVKESILKMLMLVLAAGLLAGCEQQSPERATLERVEAHMGADPKASLLALDSIDREGLAEPDRMLYDLLRVKASDKAYIRHTNEKPILRVVDYYDRRGDRERHAESLYYAGCIFSDLGDYSSALLYYQQALDLTPKEVKSQQDQVFKSRLLHSIGFIMRAMRLYKEAIPYLNQGRRILEQSKDSLRLVYNLQMQGSIYLHIGDLDNAEELLKESLRLAYKLSERDVAVNRMYLSGVYYKKGDFASALNMIRGIPDKVSKGEYATALGYASDIYLANDIKDTAYMYAHILCQQDSTENQKHGFQNIMESNLIDYLPKDSLISYVRKYNDIMESFVDKNADEAALLQTTVYNYEIHELERVKAETYAALLYRWVIGLALFAIVWLIIAMRLKIKNRDQKIKIEEALNDVMKLRLSLGPLADTEGVEEVKSAVDRDELKLCLRQELLEKYKKFKEDGMPEDPIIKSEFRETLTVRLKNNRPIPESSSVWNDVEKTVSEFSPNFKYRIELMFDGEIKVDMYRTALLIKFGFTPMQCATLLSKDRSTITYRRNVLTIGILGSKSYLKILDDVIHLM